MSRLRRIWLTIHRWLGLTAGLLFVLLGLTGSVLVFHRAIDEWLNPELLLTQGSGPRRPLAEIIAAAEAAYDGPASGAAAVTAPRVANGVWLVWFQSGEEDELRFTQVLVDPYTAEVRGQRVWGEYLTTWIYRLHFQLLAGRPGGVVVGVAGLVLVVSCVSGVWLWWPLLRHSWRAAFAIRRGARQIYDLHKTTGALSAGLLVLIAFTGVYMAFPEWVKPLVTTFSRETPPVEGLKPASGARRQAISPDRAIEIARGLFPDARFDHLHPAGPEGVYEVALRQPGEVQQSFGRTQVFIDPYTAKVLAVRDPNRFTFADSFIAWQYPLHNGEAFGLAGRWVVFFLGLTPTLLYLTGAWVWWKRRSKRSPRLGASQRGRSKTDRAPQTVSLEIASR